MVACPDTELADCRARLLRAATEVFAEEGYRASIDSIASRAGVARQTLYNHFESKAELFSEAVRDATATLLLTLDGEGHTLRERLLRFGIAYRSGVLSSVGLGFFRALVSESARFPELVANFYNTCSLQTARRLRTLIEGAMRLGELRPADPEFATKMLLSMLVGADRIQYLFSGETPPETDPALVGDIIDAYLRAFGPEKR